MKRRFLRKRNKVLAMALAAAMAFPMLPAGSVQAAESTPLYTDETSAPAGWKLSGDDVVSYAGKTMDFQKGGTADYTLGSAVSTGHFKLEYEVNNSGVANALVICDSEGKALINIGGAASGNMNLMPAYEEDAVSGASFATRGTLFTWMGLCKSSWKKVVLDIDLDKSNKDGVLNFTLDLYTPDGDYKGTDTKWKIFEAEDTEYAQKRTGKFSQQDYIKPQGGNKGTNIISSGTHANGAATAGITKFDVAGIHMLTTGKGLTYDNIVMTADGAGAAAGTGSTPPASGTPEEGTGSSGTGSVAGDAVKIYTDETEAPAGWIMDSGAVVYSKDDKGGNTSNKLTFSKAAQVDYKLDSVMSTGHVQLAYDVYSDGVANALVVYDSAGNALVNIGGAGSGNMNIMPAYENDAASGNGYATSGTVLTWMGLCKSSWKRVVLDIDLDKSNADGVLNFTLELYTPDGDYKGTDTKWKLFATEDTEGGQKRNGQFSQQDYIKPRGNNKGGNIIEAGTHVNGAATAGISNFEVAGIQLKTTGAGPFYDNMTLACSGESTGVSYTASDVTGITNPAGVSFTKKDYEGFKFPEKVTAKMGDGSSRDVALGKWVSEPAFDAEKSGTYVWTAPLELESGMNNPKNLSVSFTMQYLPYSYPTYAFHPTTLELEYGDNLTKDMFPTEVDAIMNDGKMGKVKVGEWKALNGEFDITKQAIYVFGANLEGTEGLIEIQKDKLAKNTNPSGKQSFSGYDVYFHVSNFYSPGLYNAYARNMELLDRGVYAVATDKGVFVSWRLLATEYGENISFNIKRNGEKINDVVINTRTNFLDEKGKAGDTYTIETILGDQTTESAAVKANDKNYISIPMQKPDPQPNRDGTLSAYTLNDAGVADVDGDGQYEFIVKWYPDNAFDSGKAVSPSSPTIFDVYKLDGTPLWRLNMGLEMPSGAHFNQFMFYDLDEDGKAELFIKTSDGTTTYKPNAKGKFDMNDESTIVSYIGDKSVVPGTNIDNNGHVNSNSHEYVTVFNGLTGEEIDTIDYVNTTGNYTDWGKADGGNRSARYNIALAYLPKDKSDANCTETIPAVLFNRGYYAKTTIAAYTLRDGKLQMEWNFVAETGDENAGKGNHNQSTGDVDQDGFDELVMGAIAIDHDGTVLWVNNGKDGRDFGGHGDSIHLAAMNPNNNNLYVFSPQEDKSTATMNQALYNAANGTRIGGSWFSSKDVGRGVAANITSTPGFESWATSDGSGIYGFDGSLVNPSRSAVSCNWRIYWDGDLLSELADGAGTEGNMTITKYNETSGGSDTLITFEGTKMCNSTKNTPSLVADLFGDWREEAVVRNEDDTELRIYMTTEETRYMIYTLMHDPVYRNAVANQNTSYNQPPHLGIYLGEDIKSDVSAMKLATANIKYPGTEGRPAPTPKPLVVPEATAAPEPESETSTIEPELLPTTQPTSTAEPEAAPTDAPDDTDVSGSSVKSEESGSLTWVWIVAGIVVVAGGAAFALLKLRKKK